MKRNAARFLVVLGLSILYGCAGDKLHREGLDLLQAGQVEEGLSALAKAVAESPDNAGYKRDLYGRRASAIEQLLGAAQAHRFAGRTKEAGDAYRRVLAIDPNNVRATSGLGEVARDVRHNDAIALARQAFKAGENEKAAGLLRPILAEAPESPSARELKRELEEIELRRLQNEPVLRRTYGKPVNLQFREANVRMVFEGLARSTGISFILDKDVRPDLKTTVFLKNAYIEDAIDLILQTTQLQRKILNANTVLIYPNTPEKLKDYQELMVKAFYLKNADVKQVQNALKVLLKTKDSVIDEKLNLLVMRDTPEAVRLAERLVAMHDLTEPEVVLDVEVIEVQRSRLLDLGIQWPNQLTLSPLSGASGLTLTGLKNLNSDSIGATVSNTVINAKREKTDANILANPRIRARNREKAKVLIGDKVPVVTTTTTATGLVSDSVQYIDVGLKLDVEPDIHLEDEVAIKIGLEVSSLVKEIRTGNGTLAYQIGTRNASTVLRIKDGETQILAGLINDQDRTTASGIPGLADLPVIGRLFSSQKDDHQKTEIVLSITPHLVRNVVRPDAAVSEFWSGTESTLRTRPLGLPLMAPDTELEGGGKPAKDGKAETGRNSDSGTSAKSVSLSWQGPTSIKSGETFKVSLRIKSDGAVRSLPFQASFDSTALQVVNVEEGGFFRQDNGVTTFASNVDANAGKLLVSVVRSDVEGAVGEGGITDITLRALANKPAAEIKVTTASPITDGEKRPVVMLPAPYSISILP